MRCHLLLPLSIIALHAPTATAQEEWRPTGGPVEAITALDADASTALAAGGSAGNLWRYDAGAGEWSRSTFPAAAGEVLAVCAMGAGEWLAAGSAGGLRLSDDGGRSWRTADTGVPSYLSLDGMKLREFNALAARGSTWLAGGGPGAEWPHSGGKGSSAAETGGAGPLRSVDGGTTWQRATAGLPVIAISRDGSPHYPAILSLTATREGFIAGTKWHGVYRSTDDGRSWTAASAGLPTSSWSLGLAPVVAAAEFKDALFAGTDAFDTSATLFRSTDGGATWNAVASDLPHAMVRALRPHDGRLLAALGRVLSGPSAGEGGGVWATSDGENWAPVGESLAGQQATALAVQGARVFAGTATAGVWRLDGGCAADLDDDGELTFFDFLMFQDLFAAGDPRADFTGDSALDFFDFLAFQNDFAAGCP